MKQVTILINYEPFHFDISALSPEDFRDKVKAPSEYEVWQIFNDRGPESRLPLDDIQIKEPVEIKNGQRYRVVPPGTFGFEN